MSRAKLCLLLAALALLLVPASADAFKYRLDYGQAKNASKEFAKELCDELPECEAYGVGSCTRRALSRFTCIIGVFYPGQFGPQEEECDIALHWGVSYSGYVALKNHGPTHCHAA